VRAKKRRRAKTNPGGGHHKSTTRIPSRRRKKRNPMSTSSSFLRSLTASLAAPALVVAIALASSNSSDATGALSLCSLAGPIALSSAVAFFVVAAYVSLAEHPARMLLADDSAALAQWQPSYRSAAAIQAPLAGIAALVGALCWRKEATSPEGGGGGSADPLWLLGACAAAFNLPYTFLVILPTNRTLLAANKGSGETRRLLVRWGHFHFLRTVAGGLASASFLVAVARSSGQATTSPSSWGPVASLSQLLRLSKSDYGV
jgi:hypothetical protein